MSSIEVKAITVPELLANLRSGEWLTPEFQRDFVWSTAQIISLTNSILDAKPIGMATVWQQEEKSELPLEHISVHDYISELGKSGPRYFGDKNERPGRYYAILDGKQRSTSIAMVFGGLRAQSGAYRHSGHYFLNADYDDVQDRIIHLTKKEVESRSLNTLASYVQQALFPLELSDFDKITPYFFKMSGAIEDPTNYPDEELPDQATIERRQEVLQEAHDGIIKSKLAVYIVPKKESLGDICDIFEVLNTTGTKVTTVDLIHASIYSETHDDDHPVLLREEIDLLADLDGLQDWSTSVRRPELVAQNLASIQIALDKKHDPRSVAGRRDAKISSIKSSDLLAISSNSWRDFFENKEFVAGCFIDFQAAVAGGRFGLNQCPYPAALNIYLSLRWHLRFDFTNNPPWSVERLNRLFRAFFWRNTFSRRYDQGFLTRVSVDITEFKDFLGSSAKEDNDQLWSANAEKFLSGLTQMNSDSVVAENVREAVTNGNVRGALRAGGLLLLHTRADRDVVDPNQDISNITAAHDLHHIIPKKWAKDNVSDSNKKYLHVDKESANWIDSPANLIPMATKSNKQWNTMSPKTAIESLALEEAKPKELFEKYFVDHACLQLLQGETDKLGDFLEARATLISNEIHRLMKV